MFVMKDYYQAKRTPYNKDDEEDVEGKVVVITGSNSGTGEATAREMAKRGAVVVMACRDMKKGEQVMEDIKRKSANKNVELIHLDLGDLASVSQCAEAIRSKHDRIDILINNAGILFVDGKSHLTKDGFEMHMGVNHLGHVLFTMLLLDLVKKAAPSRIVMVSSMGFQYAELDLDDMMLEKRGVFGVNNFGPYSNSKLANMFFAAGLAKELKGTGVTTYSLCPGMVKTDIGRSGQSELNFIMRGVVMFIDYLSLTAEQGAETIMYCSLSKKCRKQSGKMHRMNNIWNGAPDKYLNDDEFERRLWEKSLTLVGLNTTN